ncbi:alpha/beta fold hydrolase [Mesobacterium pallidum]|uniref:alpha/beta fold hydrolase n=1 Tax=Mesobacterium pallidum TaxID=2872037 RepID=UPI001EE2BB7D|nr:alpha/beta hydrolase [Mesobacterium pallidum]
MIWLLPLALAIAAPFVVEALRPAMTDAVRADRKGSFARLSRGVTRYRWYGRGGGPVAVMVHGLTTPSFVWHALATDLAEAGYRVLTYDLYGRGLSDRPPGRQDRAFFLGQFEELLENQGLKSPVLLVGYSMGGAIATTYAAAHPERVRQLVLLAPAGTGLQLGRIARMMRDVPVLGDWLMLTLYGRGHRRAIARERAAFPKAAPVHDRQEDELRWRGFLPAVLSSLRGMLSEDLSADHAAVRAAGLPVLAIWGEDDAVIPIWHMGRLAQWNRTARHEAIPGAGHGLPYTHPGRVAAEIRSFLDEAR